MKLLAVCPAVVQDAQSDLTFPAVFIDKLSALVEPVATAAGITTVSAKKPQRRTYALLCSVAAGFAQHVTLRVPPDASVLASVLGSFFVVFPN